MNLKCAIPSEVVELTLVVLNRTLGCCLNHGNLSGFLRKRTVELADIENIARELRTNGSLNTLRQDLLVIELGKPWMRQHFRKATFSSKSIRGVLIKEL